MVQESGNAPSFLVFHFSLFVYRLPMVVSFILGALYTTWDYESGSVGERLRGLGLWKHMCVEPLIARCHQGSDSTSILLCRRTRELCETKTFPSSPCKLIELLTFERCHPVETVLHDLCINFVQNENCPKGVVGVDSLIIFHFICINA